MSASEYIRREVELMKRECHRLKIEPEEWVARFAVKYHNDFARQVLTSHYPNAQ